MIWKLIKKKNFILILSISIIIGFVIINNINLKEEIKTNYPKIHISEQETEKGKIIKLSAPDELNYEDVLVSTELTNEVEEQKIKLYKTTEEKENVDFVAYDNNNNGLIDHIEWIVPHLSKQTYEIIIEISKAEHLDENKQFISDIYEEVKEQDNIWSESISNNEYVRVTFETKLSSKNDITIYPRVIFGNPKIEVYEQNSSVKIAEFTSINSNEYNKIFLTNLISTSQDVFDLKIIGGVVEFDHIIDPINNYWVESLDGSQAEWTQVGSTPFLDAQDQPTNHITVSSSNNQEGDFILADLPANADTINSVTLYIYADCGSEKIEVFLWDQGVAGYVKHTELGTCGSYSWNSFDVSADLTTEAEVNAAKFYVRSKNSGGWGGSVAVDAAYLAVDYNEVATDTCTYGGSGNWAITCSDNCVFSSTQTISGGNNITTTGSGVLNFSSGGKWSFTGSNQYVFVNSGCTLNVNSGGGWNY